VLENDNNFKYINLYCSPQQFKTNKRLRANEAARTAHSLKTKINLGQVLQRFF
jgi:hypothetical protein